MADDEPSSFFLSSWTQPSALGSFRTAGLLIEAEIVEDHLHRGVHVSLVLLDPLETAERILPYCTREQAEALAVLVDERLRKL